MNYRHAYHAGNFADVFKHIVLIALIQAMARKDAAFCYLDTHAGVGSYDLTAMEAKKSKEFETGISKLLTAKEPPILVKQFLDYIRSLNNNSELQQYPGSPVIAKHFMRKQDRLILSELHPEDFASLKKHFSYDKQVGVHHQDGYQALKAFLPPKERRGLILIDPPYEQTDELSTAGSAIAQALKRFETGVFALWYPIKEHRAVERFQASMKDKIDRPLLFVDLSIYPESTHNQLNGNGIAIVNPPWQIDQTLQQILPWLWRVLSPEQQGRYEIIMNT